MIESSNPEIDVQELMAQVRREVARQQQQAARAERSNGHRPTPPASTPAVVLPPLADIPAVPDFQSSGPVDPKKERLDNILKQARESNEVRSGVPRFFRSFFRKQGGFNRSLLEAVGTLAKTNAQLNKRVQELNAAAQQQNHALKVLTDHRRADLQWMNAAAPAIASLPQLQQTLAELASASAARETQRDEELTDLTGTIADLRLSLARAESALGGMQPMLESHGGQLRDFRADLSRSGEHLRNVQAQADATGEHVRNLQRTTEQVLQQTSESAEQNDRAAEHLRNLQHQSDRQGDHVTDLREQTQRHSEHLRNLQSQADVTGEHVRNLQRTAEQLVALHDQAERAAEHLRNLQVQADRQSEQLEGVRDQLLRDAEHLRNLQAQANQAGEHLRHLQDESERATDQLKDFDRIKVTTARIETEIAHLADFRRTLSRLEERQASDAIYLKSQIAQQASMLLSGMSPAKGRKRAGTSAIAAATEPATPLAEGTLDPFYLAFENRFRGTRAEIKDRVRFYLPILKAAKVGTAAKPVLDVGCGRGEWLELLEENKLRASGIDLNRAMIAECEERNLKVTHAEVIAHLRSLGNETLGCVSGFHIIEHLPFEVLLELAAQTWRVLKPGGLAIFESPNCKNLMVGACYFNVDPTHRNPVFPETAQFILETQGFEQVQLEYLSPAERPFTGGDHDAEMMNDLLFGAQDFAVIGRKPSPR